MRLPTFSLLLPDLLINLPMVADLLRSDHAAFWEASYPALIPSDTAELRNPNYHCAAGPDTVGRLDHEFATKVVRTAVVAVLHRLHAQ